MNPITLMTLKHLDRTFDFRDEDFEGLIFDCDGTLTDSMPLHFVAWQSTMRNHGIEFTEERFYSMAGIPSQHIIESLSAEQNVVINVHAASDEKENLFLTMLDQLQSIPVICDIARRNHGVRPISVASGGTHPLVLAQLQQIELIDVFPIRVCAEDTVRHKPEPDVFLKAAEQMQVEPTRCCVFEDSPLGFEGARRAGMCYVDIRQLRELTRVR
jgi:beta-phosphoglucomutase-like phosphatase (HAD superfamily)